MKKILLILLILTVVAAAQNTTCVYYFHGNGCPACAAIEPHITEIKARYSNLELHEFEVYDNRDNAYFLLDFYKAYGVPENNWKIPAVFTEEFYLIGVRPIRDHLEPYILEHLNIGSTCPSLNKTNGSGIIQNGGTSPMEPVNLWTLIGTATGAAFADSINPCAIAVLIILLTAILMKAKKRFFLTGFAFISSIYIAYFLFGLGLFSALQVTGLSYWFYQIIGWLAVGLGLFNLKDYFWHGKVFVMEIPRSWRPTLGKILKGITNPVGAFLMGFLVCLFELPCTGGPYFFTIGLLAEHTTQSLAIPILLYYNLIFVFPLILITLIIGKGLKTAEQAKKWKEKNMRLLHLVTGLILLGLGSVILLGWI